MKKHNFSAGPSILPQPVFKEAARAVTDFQESGLSILEISHRSAQFEEVMNEATSLVSELLGLNDDYKVLFLSGGVSYLFIMTAMNLLADGEKAYFVDTGSWSSKAIKEAGFVSKAEVIASSKDLNYSYIPDNYIVPADGAYLHLTSNNTIFGTQYHTWPDSPIPIVCDMSSDIFSRPVDTSNVGLFYAGAQKNLGPAGTTLVVIREDMRNRSGRQLPTMLSYETHIKKNSAFNTPPVFPIYVSMLNLRWLKNNGGLEAARERNEAKAAAMYAEIDRNPLFKGVARVEDRSWMNATFVLKNDELKEEFLENCREAGCVGVKGHRSVGGFRASMYNAMPLESVQVLVEIMKEFEKKKG